MERKIAAPTGLSKIEKSTEENYTWTAESCEEGDNIKAGLGRSQGSLRISCTPKESSFAQTIAENGEED